MEAFKRLDDLLSSDEDQYYANDSFLEAEELIRTLTAEDIDQMVDAWNDRDPSWRDRFAQASSSIQLSTLESLLKALIDHPVGASHILSLMSILPNTSEHSLLRTSLVTFATSVWHSSPELHRQVQMCTWACGLSGQLLRSLGFKSWREAGL